MNDQPPKWIDKFLTWYCNPELLEIIQGDAHELYFERLEAEGKRAADRKYLLDIIRFCRWSNINRINDDYKPSYLGILWSLNFKIAVRSASRNKLLFSVKMISLSLSLAFALLLSAFVLQEFSYDDHINDADRIYRVGTLIEVKGTASSFGESPESLAEALVAEIPEIETAAWYDDELYDYRNVFKVGEQNYSNEKAFSTSSDFAEMLDVKFIQGNSDVLDEFNTVVLTESTAKKFFGDDDPMYQTIEFNGITIDVAGIIEDPSSSSHLRYDLLLSWDGYDFLCYCWDGVEVYTYVKLREGADINLVEQKISTVMQDHRLDIGIGRGFKSKEDFEVAPIVENIRDVHLGKELVYDTAKKRNYTNIQLLIVASVLFFLTGFINFLNLSLVEITTNFKKNGVLQLFGGSAAGYKEVTLASTLLGLLVILPLTAGFVFAGLEIAHRTMDILIEKNVLFSWAFVLVIFAIVIMFLFLGRISSYVIYKSGNLLSALKGKLSVTPSGLKLRELLVGFQLSFSIVMIALILIIVDQFQFINTADKGFEDKNTVVIKVHDGSLSDAITFTQTLKDLKEVKETGMSSFYTDEFEWKEIYEIESDEATRKVLVNHEYWTPGFASLLNIELIKGREFDNNRSTDKHGAYLINETAATAFGWTDPLGKIIIPPNESGGRYPGKVIGVVKDFNFTSLHKKIEPLIIFMGNDGWTVEYIYLKLDPIRSDALIAQVEEKYLDFYGSIPFEWEYPDAQFANLYKEDYQIRDIFQVGLFISILVSCLGIFSISALLVLLRAKEMGIRKIVGADQIHLFGLHIKNFFKFILIAVAIAWPFIYFLSNHWLDNFAYRIDLSIWYFAVPGLITLFIILLTSGFHGLKSSRINPAEILNQE